MIADLLDILDLPGSDVALLLLCSFCAGLLIGLDREIRGKPAGLRTHALVAFASTLLTLAAARQADWTMTLLPGTQLVSDPSRMAHGILTGIGFLGAGVILRQGVSVHGLTTAASLWITAALGIVYGTGLLGLAITGTVATLVVLVALRVLFRLLPTRTEIRVQVTVEAGTGFDADDLRRLLNRAGYWSGPISRSFDREGGRLQFGAMARGRSEGAIDRLGEELESATAIRAFVLVSVADPGGLLTGGDRD